MDSDFDRILADMEDTLTDLERTLQDFGMAQDLYEQATGEGFDPSESTVADLMEFVQANLEVGEPEVEALQDAVAAFLETADADAPDGASAEAFGSWAAEQANGEDEETGNGEGDEPRGDEVTMEDLESVKETVGTVATALEDIKDMLSAREDQREDTLEELERRLSDIEDEPVHRSLVGGGKKEDFGGPEGENGEQAEATHEDVML